MKRVPFSTVACQLKFGSEQVDEVYYSLDLFNRKDHLSSADALKLYKGKLPEDFKKWLDCCEENINILFEQRRTPDNSKSNDWDLMAL